MSKELYSIDFTIDNVGHHSDFTGFEADKTAGKFEAGWGTMLLWHDIFEHFFEESEYFKTAQLSQAGECVAMGVRYWFLQHTYLARQYAATNEFRGHEWNIVSVCMSQVLESMDEEYVDYPNDFDYSHDPEWQLDEDMYEEVEYMVRQNMETWHERASEFIPHVARAICYGYWLADKLFDGKTEQIRRYMENLTDFLNHTEMNERSGREYYEQHPDPIDGWKFHVSVREDEVVSTLKSGQGDTIYITSNQGDTSRQVSQYENIIKRIYEY